MRAIVCGAAGVVSGVVLVLSSLMYGLPASSIVGAGQLALGFFGIALCIVGWTLLTRPSS